MKQLTLLFLFVGVQLAGGQINIDTCQSLARANYPLIKQYDLIDKSTDYNLSNANKAYLPQVSLTAIAGYLIGPGDNKTELIGIGQVNQMIWDGGAARAQKNILKANSEIERSNVEISIYSIRERVNQIYFGVLVIDEQLNQLEIASENLYRSLNSIKLSKDNGLAYQTDVDEVKSELLNLEQKKTEFIFTRNGYIKMLSLLTGKPLDEATKLEKPVIIQSLDSLKNKRSELKLYNSQLELAEARSAMNKVSLMPKIGLIGAGVFLHPGIDFGLSGIDNLAVAGLSASWSLEGLYKHSNNKNLDKINTDRILNQKDAFLFTNNLQLTQAAADIEKHKAILDKDGEIVKLKNDITKSYQIRYDNGTCTMNDLITSINKQSEAQSNMALHSVQLLMSMYNYKTISGN